MTFPELVFQREGEILGRLVDLQDKLDIAAWIMGGQVVLLVVILVLVATLHTRRR